MKKLIKKGIKTVQDAADKVAEDLSTRISLVKEVVDGLPIFMSLESSNKRSGQLYDEKHYFVIPYNISEYGFALHTMRCLPESVPEVNSLPKRRVFHFANEHSELALTEYMHQSAREVIAEKIKGSTSGLESLANDIDALDQKLTCGMLLVGGVAAIFNPLIGAGIAAKAVLPGVAGLLNRYGLRPTGQKLSKIQFEKEVREAEKRVTKEFEDSMTLRVINPILQELEFALRTTEAEHDPLTDPNLANGSIRELKDETWRSLTETAICHVYREVYEDKTLHKQANLGPEDIRWLNTMFLVNTNNKSAQ
jgi:hypothetical protein